MEFYPELLPLLKRGATVTQHDHDGREWHALLATHDDRICKYRPDRKGYHYEPSQGDMSDSQFYRIS